MLKTIKERLGRDDEQGFTLIELMVVVLIIAILLAIAIPTFLGARNSANARAAQSNLRNALTAEQTYWTNNQAFDATPADMSTLENSLNWVTTTALANGNNVLVVLDSTNNGVILTAAGKDGNCYSIEAIDQPAGSVAAGTFYYEAKGTGSGSSTSCGSPAAPTATPSQGTSAAAALKAGTPAWSTGW